VRTPAGRVWDCRDGHGRFALLGVLRGLVRGRELDAAWKGAFFGPAEKGCQCPVCRKPMSEVRVDRWRVDVCRKCRALWLDRVEVEHFPDVEHGATKPNKRPDLPLSTATTSTGIATQTRMQERYQYGEPVGDGPSEQWKFILGALGLPVEMGSMRTATLPWMTWGLCAVLLLIGAITISGNLHAAVATFGFLPSEPWRLAGMTWVSAFFLHGGLWHLLGNVWFLWLTGDNVEDAFGRRRFLLLLVLATLCGNGLHLLLDPRGDIPCIGASGGISGVMAAYAMRFPRAQIGIAYFFGALWMRLPAWVWLGIWLIGQSVVAWYQIGGQGHVSALAHIGGAAVGFATVSWWRGADAARTGGATRNTMA
jgi:membrane associated rhomboid family serine protease